jgi:hypothetical protein
MNHQTRTFSILWIMTIVLMTALGFPSSSVAEAQRTSLRRRLCARVNSFDNQGKPLISTLLQVATDYDLPTGIEKVTPEAAHKSIEVKMQGGTVSALLDRCLKLAPDYSWSVVAGAVLIYGSDERRQPSNLFSFVLPSFVIEGGTIAQVDQSLRHDLELEVAAVVARSKPAAGAGSGFVPGGVAGSYISNPRLEEKPITLSVHNAPVREILNRIVARHGGSAWVALAYSNDLSRIPSYGLWIFVARGDFTLPGRSKSCRWPLVVWRPREGRLVRRAGPGMPR